MKKIVIFFLCCISFISFSIESFIYRIFPEEIYPGMVVSIYGKWNSDISNVYIMINNIKIENDYILYFSNERIDLLITDFYGISNFYLNSSGNSTSRILNIKTLTPIRYFSKATYKLKYTVKIDFSKIIKIGSGIVYVYIPQPVLSDTILSKKDIDISRLPDYIQDNGIYIYKIDLNKERFFSFEQVYEMTTQFKFVELTDDIEPFYENINLDFYKFYTGENSFIKPYNKLIQNTVKKIIGDEKNNIKKLRLIYNWVRSKMTHKYPPESRDVEYIFENFKGDCLSDTILFSSLARSIGIPVRINSGNIFYPVWKIAGGHFWQEAFISGIGWIPLDVSLGHAPEFMKNQNFPTDTEYYYGGADGLRIDFCRGRVKIMKPDENDILKTDHYLESLQYPYVVPKDVGNTKVIPDIKSKIDILE
ncbi:MAG TPA: transglutaminase-like domain-containing protein [Spirochaetota bacterium]|nr:transglutaminase-like domain-containing protein [Spirochaetota bacterium]HOL57740.1 transglutaminase-like domain-containing protein [Spirochaetota bacterium]HPP05341.1 transglutaminase-like domain-containing protein [Spirochaetota bacterium]